MGRRNKCQYNSHGEPGQLSRAPSRAAAAGPPVVLRPARRLAPPLGFDPAL